MYIKANANENQVISINSSARERAQEKAGRKAGQQQRRNSIFAGDIGIQNDAVAMRKQRAQKQALKIITDAWNGDRAIDQSIADIRSKIDEWNNEISENMKFVEECEEHKGELLESYGMTEEDLELLRKRSGLTELSEDEEARLAELDKKPLDEFQEKYKEISDAQGVFQQRIDEAQSGIRAGYGSIRSIKEARLKVTPPMLKAQKQADEVMEQASKDVICLLAEEAKEHVDETYEEAREEAKEKADEKAEQEEKIEERKEAQEEIEERIDASKEKNDEAEETRKEQQEKAREDAQLLEEAAASGMTGSGTSSDIQAEIKDMLHKMKLLEEDLKGASVDTEL